MFPFDKLLSLLTAFAQKAQAIIRQVFVSFGKNASGDTIQSLRNETTFNSSGTAAEVDIYGSKVFDYIEDGRPAGSKLPPQGALLDWMRIRGIPEDKEFVIRRSIAIEGIAPTPIIEFSLIEINREFNQNVAPKILTELGKLMFQVIEKGFELRINGNG